MLTNTQSDVYFKIQHFEKIMEEKSIAKLDRAQTLLNTGTKCEIDSAGQIDKL
jgi:hypothetical protein